MTSKTAKVRPISHGEIEALSHPDAEPIEMYVVAPHEPEGQVLVRATATPQHRLSAPHQIVYAAIVSPRTKDEGRLVEDLTNPVGRRLKIDLLTEFGKHEGRALYTTPEAEACADELGSWRHRSGTATNERLTFLLPDDNGEEMPLMPIYGAMGTTSIVVKDISPEDLQRRIEKALQAEFGDNLAIRKNLTRAVEDTRVNVFDIETGEALALNVLTSEAHTFARGPYRTEGVRPGVIIGGK